jgi:hypothetical protein
MEEALEVVKNIAATYSKAKSEDDDDEHVN